MPELTVAPQAGGRVVPQPIRSDLLRERPAEVVERGRVEPMERRARKLLQPVTIAASGCCDHCQGMSEDRAHEAPSRGAAEERSHAVAGRERAVDVERCDDGPRVGGGVGHGRTRLYTRSVSDGPEIFDDLYLGLQAGGALRKQRRGEELTEQERDALGRWQQMSVWRKGAAVGAFAVGTFGLGFTLGGLVFGRRARKA